MTAYQTKILGIKVDALSSQSIVEIVASAAAAGRQPFIASLNTHSAYLYHHDSEMKGAMDAAECVFIDSYPLLYWGRLLGRRLSHHHRTTGIDFLLPVLQMCQNRNLKVFFLGGLPSNSSQIGLWAQRNFPELKLAIKDGYFEINDEEIIDKINDFQPNLLIVGMGMPRQEIWIQRYRERLPLAPIIALGATFEYFIGYQKMPPRWLGPLGMEWIFRFLCDPRRLWRRYILFPLLLAPVFSKDAQSALFDKVSPKMLNLRK